MLRWFPTFQVATTCFSCSPPDLNLVVTNFMFCSHVKNHYHRVTTQLQLINIIIIIIIIINLGARREWLNIATSWTTLPTRKETRYPLCRVLGGPPVRSGQVRKISPPPGFDPDRPACSEWLYWLSHLWFTQFCYWPAMFDGTGWHSI